MNRNYCKIIIMRKFQVCQFPTTDAVNGKVDTGKHLYSLIFFLSSFVY